MYLSFIWHIMKSAPPILPKNLKVLKDLGEHIQLARFRRKLSSEQVAERTGLGRKTVYNIEKGNPTVAIVSYLQVLFVLGLEKDLAMVAVAESWGRSLSCYFGHVGRSNFFKKYGFSVRCVKD